MAWPAASIVGAAAVALAAAASLWAAGHALLYKRHPRSSLLWMAISLLLPLIGPFAYFLFGINRIRARARRLRSETGRPPAMPTPAGLDGPAGAIDRIAAAVSAQPRIDGNRVDPLVGGERAFAAMLEAIAGARRRVLLSSYIFESDSTGLRFADALAAAAGRGVEVRVLVDGVGELYGRPPIRRRLRRGGVPVARFHPPTLWPPSFHLNLMNHRKILAVDGAVAFVGGMNLSDRHLGAASGGKGRVADVHFRCSGPIAGAIDRVFRDDWRFACGEILTPPPPAEAAGEASCRVLVDGPDADLGKLQLVLEGAVAAARHRIDIVTPYFLPPQGLISALQSAALRGVEVNVVLPAVNNLPFVHWATRNMLWELLQHGVRVVYQPAPFAHTKLFVVDGAYSQIGSANLDARSLRLNFELAVEVYSERFGTRVAAMAREACDRGREVTLEEVDGRGIPTRVRDAVAWLFTPYL